MGGKRPLNDSSRFVAAAAAAAVSLQSCLTLCNPIDGNPPGSPIPGILQARRPLLLLPPIPPSIRDRKSVV